MLQNGFHELVTKKHVLRSTFLKYSFYFWTPQILLCILNISKNKAYECIQNFKKRPEIHYQKTFFAVN